MNKSAKDIFQSVWTEIADAHGVAGVARTLAKVCEDAASILESQDSTPSDRKEARAIVRRMAMVILRSSPDDDGNDNEGTS